jgi:quinoprotein glucose dehydrogenase
VRLKSCRTPLSDCLLASFIRLASAQATHDPAHSTWREYGAQYSALPPWTTFTAYDLNTGDIVWERPIGEVPELAAKGYKDTGSQFPKINPVATAAA